MSKNVAAILMAGVIVALSWLSIALVGPPAPLPASSPAAAFSAERAMVHLREIAREPHPTGSEAHARVRDYLLGELRKLGLEPEVQQATGVAHRFGVAGKVENIFARMKGTDGGHVLAIVSHYDSAPMAPGAGDSGAAVAAMLETLRALRAGPPLKNDILFLITDGEENGLLGAAAFMNAHPWAKEIDVLLNFEARGTSGPSQMFETSANNGWLIDALAKTPHPRATSLAYEIYKRLPNDTDFSVFKRHNLQGLNFAFIDGWENYHTPHDAVEFLNQGSLQQHGSYMLALALELGNAALQQKSGGNAVYFNLLGDVFLHYSQSVANGLYAVTLIGLVLLLWREYANRRTAPSKVVGGVVVCVLCVALAAIAGWGYAKAVNGLHGSLLPPGDVLRSAAYALGFVMLVLALHTAMYGWLHRKLSARGLALGGLFVLVTLALLAKFYVPGASFLLIWPALAALLALAAPTADAEKQPAWRMALLAVLGAPAALLFAPTIAGLFTALGVSQMGMPALAIFLALGLWALSPQMEVIAHAWRGLLVAALVLALGCMAWGAATTRYTSASPQPSAMLYGLDADSNRGVWATGADRTDAWSRQFLGESPRQDSLSAFFPAGRGMRFLMKDAPSVVLPAPAIELVGQKIEGETRTLDLLLKSPRHARTLWLYLPEADVFSAAIDGQVLEKVPDARGMPSRGWRIRYSNPPEEGVAVKVTVRGTQLVKMRVVDATPGLPVMANRNFEPRPATLMAMDTGDMTLVSRGFQF